MRILVTGATGFIGGAFVRHAAAAGHEIMALVRTEKTSAENNFLCSSVKRSLGTISEPTWKEIEAFAPEACVHAAWIATPGIYLESLENEQWVKWSLQFLKHLPQVGVRHVLALGTCIEYKITRELLTEDKTPIAPVSLYARCKSDLRLALENELRIPFCWGRVFYPYGPGEHPAHLCTSLIQKLWRNEKLSLKTPGSTKDYIYIDDLASAMLLSIEQKFSGALNFGTGKGVTIRQMADFIAVELGKQNLVEELQPPQEDPLGFVVANAEKLKSLGWKPKNSLSEGLKKLIASVAPARNI